MGFGAIPTEYASAGLGTIEGSLWVVPKGSILGRVGLGVINGKLRILW